MRSEQLIGQHIGPYLIEAVLGSGGMSVVYRARIDEQPPIALKILFPPPDTTADVLERFEREARTAARLNHPNLVTVLDAGQADGRAFLAMQLVEGHTLSDRLATQGRLDESAAIDLAWQLADALYYAHGQGVVHRDIKPSNILLTEDGRALLTDFGVAQALDDPVLTRTGYTVGTPAYMSPEQAGGERDIDGRADLYSLGVVLYQMITGRLPFHGGTPQMMHAHVYKPPPAPSELAQITPDLETIILRALAKEPGDRFQSGASMATALNALGNQTTELQLETTEPKVRQTPRMRRRYWVGLLTLIAIALAAWEFTGRPLFNAGRPSPQATNDLTNPTVQVVQFTNDTPAPQSGAEDTPEPTPDLPYPVGTLLQGSGDGIFRMTAQGKIQHIYDFATFVSLGLNVETIQSIDDDALQELPSAGELTRLLQTSNGALDWVINGGRWRIGRWQEPLAAGYRDEPPSLVDEELLERVPLLVESQDLPVYTLIREGNNFYLLVDDQLIRRFPDEALLVNYGYTTDQALDIPEPVRNLYRTGAELTPLLRATGTDDIYLIEAGQRRLMPEGEGVFDLGYRLDQISGISAAFVERFPVITVTASVTLDPTAVPEADPTAVSEAPEPTCEVAIAASFAAESSTLTEQLGCPRGEGSEIEAAWQPFERGQMLWRNDENFIYVLQAENEQWFETADRWRDGDDLLDPSIIAPATLQQPVRGFGLIWRERALVDAVGFGTSSEVGFLAIIQRFEQGEAWFNEFNDTIYIFNIDDTFELIELNDGE